MKGYKKSSKFIFIIMEHEFSLKRERERDNHDKMNKQDQHSNEIKWLLFEGN